MILRRKKTVSALCAVTAALIVMQSASVRADAVFGSSRFDTERIDVVIDTGKDRKNISRYIYGINDDYSISDMNVYAVKQSGEALSSYNWETNTANLAAEGEYENSYDLVSEFSRNVLNNPALLVNSIVNKAELYDIPSRYVTLQMMGYAANDAAGKVDRGDTSKRWAKVQFNKNSDLLTFPDVHDDTVYMDEYVSYLVNKYGFASDGGINGYFLDSEPENWAENYAVLGLEDITSEELISRSSRLSETIKEIDPTALVYGPSVKGIESYVSLQNPDDWTQHTDAYSWFIDYYLDKMREESEKRGIRLLDVLDLHFITEAKSVVLEPVIGTDSRFANEERMQAVRVLWDSNYTENSSTAILYKQYTPLIPTIQASIRMYYPGTKLSFSEYNFGGGNNISGGIAQADALGVFGEQGVYMAALKPDMEDYPYQKSGINIYTDYDGNGSRYGNTSVYADNGGDVMSSVYASVDAGDESSLKAIFINKNMNAEKPASVKINCETQYHSARIYSFNEDSAEITLSDTIEEIENNEFEYVMDPLTVYLFEFDGSSILSEEPVVPEEIETSVSETEPEHVDISSVTESAVTEVPVSTAVSSAESIDSTAQITDISDAATAESVTVTSVNEESAAVSRTLVSEEENTPSPDDTEEEPTVPEWIKAIISLLAAAVVVFMLVIAVNEYFLGKNKK